MVALAEIVIVGASLTGIRTAEALRRQGYAGRLALVGDERHRPYDRPPLSKEVLRGERSPEQLALVKPEAFDALRLDLHLGTRATRLDLAARRVELEGGRALAYDGLVVATGARARHLPGTPPLAGIHVLRTLDDALALRADLEASPRVAVVGAGFIGAEVAATCRQRGLDVTLIEALPHPMARVLNREVGMLCASAHADAGVDVRLGAGVAAIEGGSRVERVRLQNGSAVAADVVVVGIGAIPETRWLEGSGLALGDGVICDASLCAAPGVVAAGDVARWHHEGYGLHVRLEHWTNAVEQADAAAARLLAGAEGAAPFTPVPFVWSDQYELKIQSVGAIHPDDEMFVGYGSLAERRFVALFGRAGRLTGALAVNRVRQLMGVRRLLREGVSFEQAVASAKAAG